MSEEAKKIKPGNSDTNIYDIIKKCSLNEENEYKLMKYIQKKKKNIYQHTIFKKSS